MRSPALLASKTLAIGLIYEDIITLYACCGYHPGLGALVILFGIDRSDAGSCDRCDAQDLSTLHFHAIVFEPVVSGIPGIFKAQKIKPSSTVAQIL